MKHLLLTAAALITSFTYAQELVLESKIKTNTTYITHMTVNMEGTMNMEGPEAVVNNPQNPFPMDMENQVDMIMENKTGDRNEEGNITGMMEITRNKVKATVNGMVNEAENEELNGVEIKGHYIDDLKFELESITGETEVPESFKTAFQSTLKQLQNNIEFPEEPLNIGSTFTQNIPMEMPVAGKVMTMNIVTDFTLVRIEGEEAFFEIVTSMEMSAPMDQGSMEMSGKGTGSMVFHTAHNYYTSYITDMPMNMVINISDEVRMTAAFETLSEIKVEITSNSDTASK